MTKYHPDTRFISDFAAGSLPLSQALCVSAHLHYCDDCKQKVEQLTDLGSVLFDKISPMNLEQDFSSLMQRIDSMPENNAQFNSEVITASTKSPSNIIFLIFDSEAAR